MRTTLYLLMACLFSACSTIEYIGIETYNPAEITFPKNVDKVLIVNNAVPQPDDVGYTYNLYGTVQDTALPHWKSWQNWQVIRLRQNPLHVLRQNCEVDDAAKMEPEF